MLATRRQVLAIATDARNQSYKRRQVGKHSDELKNGRRYMCCPRFFCGIQSESSAFLINQVGN